MYSLSSALPMTEASGYVLGQDVVGDGVKLGMNSSALRFLICMPFLGELKEVGRMLSACLEVIVQCVVAALFQIIGLTVPSEML